MNKLAELENVEVSKEEIQEKKKLIQNSNKQKKIPQNQKDEIERMILSEKSLDILKNISQGNYK